MGTRGRLADRRTRARRAAAALVATGLIVASCSSGDETSPSTTNGGSVPTTDQGSGSGTADGPGKLGLRLSEGQAADAAAAPITVTDGTDLDEATVAAVLARLPEWAGGAGSAQPYNWPAQSLTPPRTGATVNQAFPVEGTSEAPEVVSGPLEVVRFQPEGDIAIAPFVTITFNQPMVPLGTLGQLAAADVPATISPAVPGSWQWIGTRTLRFDADAEQYDRLPMATDYTVTVPAGTKSANGGELAQEVEFAFRTPPLTVESFSPQGDGLELEPVFLATFDQQIDADAVLAKVSLTADDARAEVRLATQSEIEADEAVSQATSSLLPGRWLAFRATSALPADASVHIEFAEGTPSAEGPKTTTTEVSYDARTYAPLKLVDTVCGWGSECPPGSSIEMQFDNELDAGAFDASTVTIEPALPGASIYANGSAISINGDTQGNTTYKVTVAKGLLDVHGQTLAEDASGSVSIGHSQPFLEQFSAPLITLDPSTGSPAVTVRSVNHDKLRVRLFSASPKDWAAYTDYVNDAIYGNGDTDLPSWKEISDEQVDTGSVEDRRTETSISLKDALDSKPGQLIVLVEPTETYPTSSDLYWSNRPTIAWVQSTQIGLDAFNDSSQLIAWATDLSTGAPLSGVSVAGEALTTATTAADGTARFEMTPAGTKVLVATKGDDTAILPAGYYGDTWASYERVDSIVWYTADDRTIYQPGETVSVKGFVRRIAANDNGALSNFAGGDTVHFIARDPMSNEIANGDATLTPLGGFDLSFELPAGANQGYAWLELSLPTHIDIANALYTHQFQIQQYRRPEFEVQARTESAEPQLVTAPLTVAVDANYYAGGPLGAAPVAWSVSTSQTSYSPPGWDGFAFGVWTPWWIADSGRGTADVGFASDVCCFPGVAADVKEYTGETDAAGSHYLQIDFHGEDGGLPDLPSIVSANASVQDVNRQTWAATTNVIVHPGQYYAGLRSDRAFVKAGDPLRIESVVSEVDGAAVPGREITLTASRVTWGPVKGQWTEQLVDPQTCTVTSAAEPVPCEFDTSVGGQYRITTAVTDDNGGRSRTELTVWVSGAESFPSRNVTQETVTIVPDSELYAPGDTAELLVQAPFTGDALVTLSHNDIVSTEHVTLADGSAVVQVPITEDYIGGLGVSIEAVGAATRLADDGTELPDAPKRPAYAVGQLTLPISKLSRALTVTATPRDEQVEPGANTAVDVSAKNADGAPVEGAEFAIAVVDEAVLALSGARWPDPLDVFYGASDTWVNAHYGRGSIVLDNPISVGRDAAGGETATADTQAAAMDESAASATTTEAAAAERSAAPLASADGGAAYSKVGTSANGEPIAVRSDFNPVALFKPDITTDANGAASVDVPLPDNLTRYRIMVVAVSGSDRFGSAESNLTARLPLMVRPSAPRFANFGDAFELPVVVQNQTDAAMDVDVVLQTGNLTLGDAPGRRVTVPANDRVETRFSVSAASAGTAAFRVVAVSGANADAASSELPVYTPSTAEAFATYGVIDDGATVQPLLAPTGVIPQFGGLEVSTSSTAVQALTDAVLYLEDYPYRSADAFASRILAISALRDVLTAFAANGLPDAATLEARVNEDLTELVALQNDDGGFGFWARYRPSDPYVTVEAAHALVVAQQKGFIVPVDALQFAMSYLVSIESHMPSEWPQELRDSITAYALYVRSLNGDRDSAAAQAIWDRGGEKLPADVIARLWPIVTDEATIAEMERYFANHVVETAGAANFVTDYGDSAYLVLHSDRRTDGIVLDALMTMAPQSDLIPKVVTGLLGNQTKGRWNNIQENSFILLALGRYFETYEAQTPEFVARMWLGDRFAGDHTFSGRSTDRVELDVPMTEVIAAGNTDLTIGKEGAGRLYYRLGLRYAPESLELEPLDRGFVVQRTYEGVDDAADVTRDADGTWHIKAGARVRVRLVMVAESQRTQVALVDPLPAGLEILNPALAVTEAIPTDDPSATSAAKQGSWWWGPWFEHQNLRNDRAEAFTSWLPAGTYDYSYVARATTPGTFVAPPTRAEEIYAPETFGRAATDHVVIG